MTIRPTDALLPPVATEADRKPVRAFWRGFILGMIAMVPLLRAAFLWGTWQ